MLWGEYGTQCALRRQKSLFVEKHLGLAPIQPLEREFKIFWTSMGPTLKLSVTQLQGYARHRERSCGPVASA